MHTEKLVLVLVLLSFLVIVRMRGSLHALHTY